MSYDPNVWSLGRWQFWLYWGKLMTLEWGTSNPVTAEMNLGQGTKAQVKVYLECGGYLQERGVTAGRGERERSGCSPSAGRGRFC